MTLIRRRKMSLRKRRCVANCWLVQPDFETREHREENPVGQRTAAQTGKCQGRYPCRANCGRRCGMAGSQQRKQRADSEKQQSGEK